MSRTACIAVDLDGTLAHYHGWRGTAHIGEPNPAMVARVKRALAAGAEVWIFTARLSKDDEHDAAQAAIDEWCLDVFGHLLPATAIKLHRFQEFWDDRAVRVVSNTGRTEGGGPLWDRFSPPEDDVHPQQLPLYGDA